MAKHTGGNRKFREILAYSTRLKNTLNHKKID